MNSEQGSETSKVIQYKICSPSGTFPEQSLKCDFGGLYISEQLIILAWDEGDPNAQQKLVTALLMATDFHYGLLKLYLLPFIHSLEIKNRSELFNLIGNDIRRKITEKHILPLDIFPEFDHYQNSKGASLPIILGGVPYHKVNHLVDPETFESIANNLNKDMSKDLFILSEYLLRSGQLSCHFQFQQEASNYLLAALEYYQSLGWYKAHPSFNDWKEKLGGSSCLDLAKEISPIEYVKLYKLLLSSIKNAYLAW